jgi:ribosomal protein L13
MLKRLRVYAGPTHPHEAQQPKPRQVHSTGPRA